MTFNLQLCEAPVKVRFCDDLRRWKWKLPRNSSNCSGKLPVIRHKMPDVGDGHNVLAVSESAIS